jgi:hypothetical protein
MGSRYKPSICWIWLFGILGIGGPNGLAAGETNAPKSLPAPNPAVTAAPGAEEASSAAKPALAEPYDFKGIKLGISIDQFRNTAFPDTPHSSADLKTVKLGSVHVLCSVDGKDVLKDVFELTVLGDEKAAGITKCRFYRKMYIMKDFTLELSEPLRMGGGDHGARGDPSDGVPKPFKIALPTRISAMPDVLEALTDKFGPASSASEGTAE